MVRSLVLSGAVLLCSGRGLNVLEARQPRDREGFRV